MASAPATYRLPNVEIFATGNHDGEEWTERDLDEIAANFARLKGRLDPPLVVGHEDDQQLLERTGIPAAGWLANVRKMSGDGPGQWKLVADAENVPAEVAGWINSGLYRKVSAELYDSPEQAGLDCAGKTLRRVALLGGEIPKVKTLGSLPFAEPSGARLRFSESKRRPGLRRVTFFSERPPMDREQLAQVALQLGLSQATIDLLKDDQLAAVVLELQAKAAGMPPGAARSAPETPPAPNQNAEFESASGGRDSKGHGADFPDERQAMMARMREAGTLKSHAEIPSAPTAGGAQPSQISMKYAELERKHAILERQIQEREKLETERSRQAHEALVSAFCERMVKEKKILPSEMDKTSKTPNLYHRLLRADPVKRVHRFSEGGRTVEKTELEMQMAEIEALDPAHLTRFFSEKLPQGGTDGQKMTPERRQQLLKHTLTGKAVLAREAAK